MVFDVLFLCQRIWGSEQLSYLGAALILTNQQVDN